MAGAKTTNGKSLSNGRSKSNLSNEVLTLVEAAAYLRIGEADVVRLAECDDLPGRQIGMEWRFLKSGLQDWLRAPKRKAGKTALLALAGAWKDDPDVSGIVRAAQAMRGRTFAETES